MHWILISVDLLITCTVSLGAVVKLSAKINTEVYFYLPPFAECGEYTLTNPGNYDVIKINGASRAEINELYRHRSTYETLGNGTVKFTLRHLNPNDDDGTFLVLTSRCHAVYSVRVTTERIDNRPAYWSAWDSWSSCTHTCGSHGYRTRSRECVNGPRCHHGKGRELEECMNFPCPSQVSTHVSWTTWSAWSECSRTCDKGTRSRARGCVDEHGRSVQNEDCVGLSTERTRCNPDSCVVTASRTHVSWTTWSAWSECSRTCDSGTRSRARGCVDEHGRSVQNEGCVGVSTERTRCNPDSCVADQGVTSDSQTGSLSEPVLSLPLSVVIGTGATLVVLILLVVIIVLLVKLSKRGRRSHGDHSTNAGGTMNNHIQMRNKKHFNNDVSVDRVTSSNTYAEIDDDSEFDTDLDRPQSQLTIDNQYSAMPRSSNSSAEHGRPSSAKYLNVPNPGQKVKVKLNIPDPGQRFKVSDGGRLQCKENDARVDVDRQKCIYYNSVNIDRRQFPSDSAGYAVPLGALR